MSLSGRGPKALACLAVVLAMVLGAIPAMAKVGQAYYCAVEQLSVHKRANVNSVAVDTLKRGEKVVHLSTKNGLWRVQIASGEGFVKPKTKKGDRNLVEKPYKKDGIYVVKGTKRAILRESPSTAAAALDALKRYTAVKLTKLDGYWGYVTTQNGTKGWIRLKFISPV